MLLSLHFQGFHGDIDSDLVAVVADKGIEAKFGSLDRDKGIGATRGAGELETVRLKRGRGKSRGIEEPRTL
jgi:hypothetical protein